MVTLRLYDNYTRTLRDSRRCRPAQRSACTPAGRPSTTTSTSATSARYLFEDVLKRVLRWNGYAVRHVMNITDVGHLTSDADTGEDKMEKGARRTGRSAWEIAAALHRGVPRRPAAR